MNLRDHLAELAEDVRPVDLRDQVVASSRRATRRRRVVAGTTASVVALALAAGIAWGRRPVPDTDVVTPPSPSPSTPARDRMPATLFYLTDDGGRPGLTSLDHTATARDLFTPPAGSCGLAVARDGSQVAWVTLDGGGTTGDLIVAPPAGTSPRTVLGDVACSGAPYWLPASRDLVVHRGGARVTVNVPTGSVDLTDPLAGLPGTAVQSPNGKFAGYVQAGRIVVARPGGEVVHRVAHTAGTPAGGFSVRGVSDDGSRVVVGPAGTDAGQIRAGIRLVDAATGDDVPLPPPVAAADPTRAVLYPAPGNRLLVRAEGRLHLLGPDLAVLDTRAEPAGLSTATLLRPY